MKNAQDHRTASAAEESTNVPECFVMMPFSDVDGYSPGHFLRVFEDIFVPACRMAGYRAIRADQIRETNLIHLDVLQRLLEAPIALCDLSSRNPNVLFELGLRQAFDKPVVLVQETGTPPIFDIAPLRYTQYRSARLYHEVLEDQEAIAAAIKATIKAAENDKGINSLVRILALTKPAALVEVKDAERDPALQLVRAELDDLRSEIREALRLERRLPARHSHNSDDGDYASSLSSLTELPCEVFDDVRERLPPRDVRLLDLFYGFSGKKLTVPEIADVLGIDPKDAVRSIIFAHMRATLVSNIHITPPAPTPEHSRRTRH